jgi:hypothetical protein
MVGTVHCGAAVLIVGGGRGKQHYWSTHETRHGQTWDAAAEKQAAGSGGQRLS